MREKLRVGIAGYGVVGKRRRYYIDQHPHLKTVAVCDWTFPKEGTFEDGLRYYLNYQQLLKEDLDIIFVCITNDMAPEVTIASLEKTVMSFARNPRGGTSRISSTSLRRNVCVRA